jgi:hypothetical protein
MDASQPTALRDANTRTVAGDRPKCEQVNETARYTYVRFGGGTASLDRSQWRSRAVPIGRLGYLLHELGEHLYVVAVSFEYFLRVSGLLP